MPEAGLPAGVEVPYQDVERSTLAGWLAAADYDQALAVARSIDSPWYRCQSLAYVAEWQPDRVAALAVLDEAFDAAGRHHDVNRIVSVASWPLRPLARLAPELADARLTWLLQVAATEPHNLRRADALVWVAAAVAEVAELKARAVPPLLEALLGGHGWRIERLMADTAHLIAADYPDELERLLAAHPENRRKRKLLRELGRLPAA